MLFAGSTWSELPISTSKEQDLNGEEFGYDFLIDQILPLDLDTQEEKDFILDIQEEKDFVLDIQEEKDFVLYIQEEKDFVLPIDQSSEFNVEIKK